MYKILNVVIFILITLLWTYKSFAVNWAIDMDVSPIKYEIEWNKWDVIKKIAKIKNNTSKDVNIQVWKWNFTNSDQPWVPKFLGDEDNSLPDQEIASWISIDKEEFLLKAHQEKEIEFTINIPNNATPWWHYWDIIFKNKDFWTNWSNLQWNSLWINVDYRVLVILNVAWKVISKWTVWEPIITVIRTWEWWSSNYIPPKKDNCPLWDLTTSKYDWKCIDLTSENKKAEKKSEYFEVKIEIPFVNKWNTHIKPKWKIKLINEDGEIIKWVWKETQVNQNWAIIWDKVVDYIPINDAGWNILPNSERNFDSYWKWFPYKSYDKDWNEIIKYWSPWEYYSKQNVEDWKIIMPWQRISERTVKKKIRADVEITYKENNEKDVNFNSAKDFNIEYEEKYVWLNPYVVIPASIIILIFFIFFIKSRKNKKRCTICNKKIDKDMKICPYCEAKQKTENIKQENKKEEEEIHLKNKVFSKSKKQKNW